MPDNMTMLRGKVYFKAISLLAMAFIMKESIQELKTISYYLIWPVFISIKFYDHEGTVHNCLQKGRRIR